MEKNKMEVSPGEKLGAFEREALGKALELAASGGDWGKCDALIAKLGEAAWTRPSLMGESPQVKAFTRAWSAGVAPPPEWQAARRDAPGAFSEMEACALDLARRTVASADASRSALAWLARSAPSLGLGFIFENCEGFQLKNKDLSGWAEALAERAREGSLDAGWGRVRGMWMMRSELAPGLGADAFDDAFAHAGMLHPLFAASMGCLPTAERWIKSIKPEQALAALAARLAKSEADWASFEAVAFDPGLGSEPHPWRVLACEGEQCGDRDFIKNFGFPAWGERSWASGAGYQGEPWARKALGALARQAAPLLSTSPAMRDWIVERAPAEVSTELSLKSSDYDFSSFSREAVLEAIERASKLDSPELADLGRLAAERLWELRERMKSPLRISEHFDLAAGALWRGASPEAFEAYGRRLGELCGSAGEAAYLCGIPEPLLRREAQNQPGSPGHLIALGRVFPPGCMTLEGVDRWRASEGGGSGWAYALRRSLGVAHLSSALKAGVVDRWRREPAPEMLPPIERWGEINLLEPKWRAGALGASLSAGYESALEALCELALQGDPEYSEPDSPSTGGADDAPSRMAWRRYAASRPAQCAKLLAERWTGVNKAASEADRVVEFLDPEQKALVARELPAAIEQVFKTWGARTYRGDGTGGGSGARPQRAHEVSRQAARALASASEEAFDARDRLCAACMAASAYGMARALSERSGKIEPVDRSLLIDSAAGLRDHLPRAALILQGADPPWVGPNGFNGAELAAKAAWGALALEAVAGGTGSWSQRWAGVQIDPASPQAHSLLSAIFTPMALDASRSWGRSVLQLTEEAYAWIAPQGADGMNRMPGVAKARSALECAVDCLVDREWRDESPSSFGPEICQALVARGADPSAPDAPSGNDALALACKLHRRESPSKVMKALLSSPLAKPGRGALWSILTDASKAKLSEKLIDELLDRARAEPEMSGLALVAEGSGEFDARAQREMERAFKEGAPARALAGSGLLGAMARAGASSMRCGDAAQKMRAEGVEPTEQDAIDMAIHGLLSEALNADGPRTRVESGVPLWVRAGAWGGRLDVKSFPSALAEAVCGDGLGETPTTGEVYVELAARAWREFDLTVVRSLLPGVVHLHETGLGSEGLSQALSKLLVSIQGEAGAAQLVARMGLGTWESLEAVALAGVPAIKRGVASKRI